MSDKNRVLTNRIFRKKMAALLGTSSAVNHFNDFEALDQTTFAKEMDKLIANPPWGEGGGSSSDILTVIFTFDEDTEAIICNKTVSEIKESTKPIAAYLIAPSGSTSLERSMMSDATFVYSEITSEGIMQIIISGNQPNTWTMTQNEIPIAPTASKQLDYTANILFNGTAFEVDDFADDNDQQVTFDKLVTALGIVYNEQQQIYIPNMPSKYINVRTSVQNSQHDVVNHGAVLQFTDIDLINKVATFSATSVDTTGATPTPIIFTLTVKKGETTDTLTFTQHTIS